MIEFHPPTTTAAEDVADVLGGSLALRVAPERGRERSYYDTFDGRLRARDLVLVHREGELALTELASGALRAREAMPRPRRPWLVSEMASGRLRDALDEVVGIRALLPLARLRCRERALDVLDDERKTVVRLSLCTPAVLADPPVALPVRLGVSGLRGYDDELAAVCRVVTDELFFVPVAHSLIDEAVLGLGGQPGGISSKAEVALTPDQSAASAVSAVLTGQLAIIEANLPGALAETDTEFLHDLRVAVRRTRAVQRECREVFEPERLAHFRTEFRWLQAVSGPARDMDVYLLGFEELRAMVAPGLRADLEPLVGVLRARHRRAHAALRRALGSARCVSLLEDWRAFVAELGFSAADDSPIGELAGGRIRRVYRQMVRMGEALGDASPAEEYHELRKKGKELRYLLELFGAPLYPPAVVKPLIKSLKGLQDVLGRHQDREVQAATVGSLRDEVAAAPGGVAGLVAIGALVQRLSEDEQAARAQFAESFAPFAAKAQRKLVRETFR